MLNKESYMKTSAEVCTQIASYFDVVDNCIALSDTNKAYSLNPQTSYSPSPPIKSGSYTTCIISPNTHNTADIYNGFIRADMKVMIKIDKPILSDLENVSGYNFGKVWFGFKDARDAVEKYEIVANGMTLYTQNFGCEESFLTACCANEVTKRADIYSKARHKDIWNDTHGRRCGFVANLNKDVTSVTETIRLKIDLRRFLPLSNIKYLPAFAGKIELRLYFSTAGMVYCPVGFEKSLVANPHIMKDFNVDEITNEFRPIGEPIWMWTSTEKIAMDKINDPNNLPPVGENHGGAYEVAGANNTKARVDRTIYSDWRTWSVVDYSIEECASIIPCFGIHESVYTALVQRYANPQHPLTFPTQIMSFYTCTRPLNNEQDKATITITPNFVDSMFCLFPLKHTHKTYFKNPMFEAFHMNCGNYNNIPAKAFGTNGKYPEFLEYCQNAMNMNGEQNGFNKEVIASLANEYQYNENTTGYYPNDRSSFFIGLPTETDGTYQQGLSSLAPINFELICSQKADNPFRQEVDTPPLLCLLTDISISILIRPNGMPPSVRIGPYDLTTPE